jgi:hypothetical protein
MKILISLLLFSSSLLPTYGPGSCPDTGFPRESICALYPSFQGEDVMPAVEAPPSLAQTKKEWAYYFSYVGKHRFEIALDGFEVRPHWVQGNASFSIIFQFNVGDDSHPADIYLVLGEEQIDVDAAKACLAKWTLSGLLPNKKYFLLLNWEHVKGYTMLTIIGEQMSLTIKLQQPS